MRERNVIIGIFCLALALNISGVRNSSVVSAIKSGTQFILYPVQTASHSTVNGVSQFVSFVIEAGSQRKTNQKLLAENNRLRFEMSELNSLRVENQILKEALGFRAYNAMRFKKIIAAEILSRTKDLWNRYIIINAGENQGVRKGFAVISDQGLAGRVIEAGPLNSKVRLLIDLDSQIAAFALQSRVEALAQGDGFSLLKLRYVPAGSDLKLGEEVVVSSSSEILPGVPIGRISKVENNEKDIFQHVEVVPAVDFSKLKVVYVVLQ